MAAAYDAFLLVSFGGPEKRDDVIPFLENVLRGRNVPRERLLAVAEHYYHFDGRSPINDQCRALLARSMHRASECPSTGATVTGIPCSRTPSGKCARTASSARSRSRRPRSARTPDAVSTVRT